MSQAPPSPPSPPGRGRNGTVRRCAPTRVLAARSTWGSVPAPSSSLDLVTARRPGSPMKIPSVPDYKGGSDAIAAQRRPCPARSRHRSGSCRRPCRQHECSGRAARQRDQRGQVPAGWLAISPADPRHAVQQACRLSDLRSPRWHVLCHRTAFGRRRVTDARAAHCRADSSGFQRTNDAHAKQAQSWSPCRIAPVLANRGGRTRTCNPRFWRPVLYQLSHAPGLHAAV